MLTKIRQILVRIGRLTHLTLAVPSPNHLAWKPEVSHSVLSGYPIKLCHESGITDLEIAGLRRRDGREQSAIGFEIEQRRAI